MGPAKGGYKVMVAGCDPYTDTITTLYKLYYHSLSAIKVLPIILFLVGSIPLPMVRVHRRLSILPLGCNIGNILIVQRTHNNLELKCDTLTHFFLLPS